ncbi:MAG: hypothetical protein GX444_19115 [Myxococcales bacterium]|nr:hypothetical protein [Myxococcales bacterium]
MKMSLLQAINNAVSGIRVAGVSAEKAASGISQFGISSKQDTMPQDIVSLKIAKASVEADVAVVRKTQEMHQALLDLVV